MYRMSKYLWLVLGLCLAQGVQAANEIKIVGSRTLEPFLQAWVEAYKKKAPNVGVTIATPGTSVAPKALLEGRADLGAMNREMTHEETENFVRVHGHYPTFVTVAIEAVGVYAHPENPIQGLTFPQLESIYAADRGCGTPDRAESWGALGIGGAWKDQRIVAFGQDDKSPIADFVKRSVLCRGNFAENIVATTHENIVNEVSKNKFALAYSNFPAKGPLKAVALKKGQGSFVAPSVQSVRDGSYKLQHFMYLYFTRPQGKSLDPRLTEFIKTGLSPEGQAHVEKAGYISLSSELIKRQLNKLQ